ncbi:class I SAM-dependent methyltransferase [Amycolatopsis sp. NPDC004368]
MNEARYTLGSSAPELERLERQAAFLRPHTVRLLDEAGIRQGMRVLDIGCGTGDVTRLVARLIGPDGFVVGVDQSPEAIAFARARTPTATGAEIRFETSDVETFSDREPFDAVVGRYVLNHQTDPVGFLRAAASHVRPGGGVLALHEIDPERGIWSYPPVPLWDMLHEWVRSTMRKNGLPHHAASRLFPLFADAGLPPPQVSCANFVGGGPDSPLYQWMADVVRTVLPILTAAGIDTSTIDVDTLADRLREQTLHTNSQIEGPGQYLAWVRL